MYCGKSLIIALQIMYIHFEITKRLLMSPKSLLGCPIVSCFPDYDAKHKYPYINPCACIIVGWIFLSFTSLSCIVSDPSHISVLHRCPLLCSCLLKNVSAIANMHTAIGLQHSYRRSCRGQESSGTEVLGRVSVTGSRYQVLST
jgi:hypothetical protein